MNNKRESGMNKRNDVWLSGSGNIKENQLPAEGKPGNDGSLIPMGNLCETMQKKYPRNMGWVRDHESLLEDYWGGGKPGHRSIFCIYGVNAKDEFDDLSSKRRLTIWIEGNPAEYNLEFSKGHDIILVKAGFAPNKWRNSLVHGLDAAGAVRILNMTKERLETNFLTNFSGRE